MAKVIERLDDAKIKAAIKGADKTTSPAYLPRWQGALPSRDPRRDGDIPVSLVPQGQSALDAARALPHVGAR